MFNTIKRDERGFSLIELAVVVAIIGILAAIAIPTFLGQREGAQDRSAQSSLRNAVVQARATAAANNSVYPGADSEALAGLLAADEPALDFFDEDVPSTGPSEISVRKVNPSEIILAAKSDSGSCWLVRDQLLGANAGTTYGKGEEGADCQADGFIAAEITADDFAAAATGSEVSSA